jgi:hypothetical protein
MSMTPLGIVALAACLLLLLVGLPYLVLALAMCIGLVSALFSVVVIVLDWPRRAWLRWRRRRQYRKRLAGRWFGGLAVAAALSGCAGFLPSPEGTEATGLSIGAAGAAATTIATVCATDSGPDCERTAAVAGLSALGISLVSYGQALIRWSDRPPPPAELVEVRPQLEVVPPPPPPEVGPMCLDPFDPADQPRPN